MPEITIELPKEEGKSKKVHKKKSLYLMARCDKNLSETNKKRIFYHELDSLDKEVKAKNGSTQFKSGILRGANIISSYIIIIAGSIITGIQVFSGQKNIPIIVLAVILTVIQSLREVFRWGPQGVFFKQATIRLKRLRRQINDIKLIIYQYTPEQIMNEIRYMRNEFDDIDFTSYKVSSGNEVKFQNEGLDVQPSESIELTPTFHRKESSLTLLSPKTG
jgi:hypothetical protein